MKQLCLCLGVAFSVAISLTGLAHGDSVFTPSLIISEIKIKNDTTGYNEFIELYNADVTSIDLNKFTIEYYNSPAPSESDQPVKQAIVADGLLAPAQTVVLASDKQQIADSLDLPFSSLSDSGGFIRLRDQEGNAHDEFAWTSTSSLAIAPIVLLSTSTSNKNKSFTRALDEQGSPVLVNPSWQLSAPSPQSFALLEAPKAEPENEEATAEPASNDTPVPETTTQPEVIETNPALLPLQLTELLPNPAPPASDSTDEFIELYNPNDEAIDLSGYRLQSGNSFSYNYTFEPGTLGPHEYKAFYVLETGVLLANSGGRARLLDSSGKIISETSIYDSADEGQAWALVNGTWQWTTSPTPGTVNVLSLPAAKAPKTAATKAATKKTAAKPKVAAAKKTVKPKTSKASIAGASSGSSDEGEEEISGIHPGIIAGVGLAALAYAVYEYRFDVRNLIYKLPRNRATRAASRAEP